MSDVAHDPMCPQPSYDQECPRCALIARVRADEREKVIKAEREERERDWAEAYYRIVREERERIAQALDHRYQDIKRQSKDDKRLTAYWDGVLDGLDAAEQIARGEEQA